MSAVKDFVLLTTLYNERDRQRCKEYITCLENNIANVDVGQVVVFYEKDADDDYLHRQIIECGAGVELVDHKPSYREFFEYANRSFPDRDIVLVNADIYFDTESGLNRLRGYDLAGRFLVLTRYNKMAHLERLLQEYPNQKGLLLLSADGALRTQHLNGSSIDAWIFRTPLVLDFRCDYRLGVVSCDGCLNYQLKQSQHIKVFNPCLDVISIHEHNGWTPGKYRTVDDGNGAVYTRREWDLLNQRNGDYIDAIPFCKLGDAL